MTDLPTSITIVTQRITNFDRSSKRELRHDILLTFSDDTEFPVRDVLVGKTNGLIGRKIVCEGSALMAESEDGSSLLVIGDAADYANLYLIGSPSYNRI